MSKKEQNKKMKNFWERLWNLLSPMHKQIKILLILTIFLELTQFIAPYILKLIIDLIIVFDSESISKIILLVFAMFAVNGINSLMSYFFGKKEIYVTAEAENFLIKNAQKKMMYLSLSYHEKENTGGKISKIRRGVDKIRMLMDDIFWSVAPTLIQVILTALILFWVDWRFGLIFSFFIPVFIFITLNLNKKVDPIRKNIHNGWEDEDGKIAQSIININTVKSFVQEKREISELGYIADKIKKNIILMFNIIFRYNIIRHFIIYSGETIIIIFGVYLAWNKLISIGSLVFVITISQKSFISLFSISRLYDRIMDSSEGVDRLYYLDKEKQDIKNCENGFKPKNIDGQIKFENVCFSYNDNKQSALNNVNLKINPNCVTALVGSSGGGKTTVARMVYRHYDPQKGEILLDGKNLKDYDLYSFRKFIAIVSQEVEIFNDSIANNISYACPSINLEKIKAVAKIANAEEFIEKLPKKYKTIVGERGIKLSGGQKQRIGIARAILANPRILIFDEATSNLDSYNEMLIQKAMEKISKNRTTIIIAHRLSTIKRADRIIVLEQGKITEQGSHLELSKNEKGLYAKLLKLQKMGDVV
ncbi:MAG: ABC transporter ATP-binding protein [Patescibacteria group bacterium]|nr:ABC transporter ATP-binding protein [Patescibacteria group bacterium]